MSSTGEDASVSKKIRIESKPVCPYGNKCYRKNPIHFKEYDHPAAKAATSDSSSDESASQVAPVQIDTSKLPPCPFFCRKVVLVLSLRRLTLHPQSEFFLEPSERLFEFFFSWPQRISQLISFILNHGHSFLLSSEQSTQLAFSDRQSRSTFILTQWSLGRPLLEQSTNFGGEGLDFLALIGGGLC